MEEDKGKKKYRYTYYMSTGKEEIEVDENWYEILRQADRDMYTKRQEWKGILSSPRILNERAVKLNIKKSRFHQC